MQTLKLTEASSLGANASTVTWIPQRKEMYFLNLHTPCQSTGSLLPTRQAVPAWEALVGRLAWPVRLEWPLLTLDEPVLGEPALAPRSSPCDPAASCQLAWDPHRIDDAAVRAIGTQLLEAAACDGHEAQMQDVREQLNVSTPTCILLNVNNHVCSTLVATTCPASLVMPRR